MSERHYPRTDIRVAIEEEGQRTFVAVKGMQVDVHCNEDGIVVQITKGNEVLGECSADFDEGV